MGKQQRGFTIVELLIVVVVIAILAAITIVSYNGITSQANDTAVQSDLRQFSMKVEEFSASEGRYPQGNGTSAVEGVGSFQLSKQSYLLNGAGNGNNFYYCRGVVSGQDRFGVGAVSATNKIYAYLSTIGSVKEITGSWTNSANICPLLGVPTTSADYTFTYGRSNQDGWFAWVK